jgi:AcrR family transcriptional regulator
MAVLTGMMYVYNTCMPRTRDSLAASLTRTAVVEEAAALVASDGYDALNMRDLAERFGVSPMTLYRHVRDKADLMAALADRMLEQLQIPAPGEDTWEDELVELFQNMHTLLVANPELTIVSVTQPIAGRAAYRGAEATLDALRRGGITGPAAVTAFGALVAFTQGFALQEIHTEARTQEQLGERLATLETLPADEYPLIKAAGPAFLIRNTDDQFAGGVRALVRGLTS